ncbi:hypothetical protein GCM10025857_30610 [Alicyclobacillus contaminans]|uniref:hypothetical protein n=1 Tax=Alicyclobacillus contaminans TaxID=392016 RepID=UPI000687E2E8|nr:hypothetical protein [Alicyclobacillus contaminans]GMA51704.1 hypothetical protein GCM10025857_30610 [Alicyclobacillus contaminans]
MRWMQMRRAVGGALAVMAVTAAPRVAPTAHAAVDTYQVVTNEISAKQPGGGTVDVYRFDPAVYVAEQGDEVVLQFRGLKGHDHPIVLDGYNLHATVRRNERTTLRFIADKPGFFHLICTAHADAAHEGPMEAYLVVTPKS